MAISNIGSVNVLKRRLCRVCCLCTTVDRYSQQQNEHLCVDDETSSLLLVRIPYSPRHAPSLFPFILKSLLVSHELQLESYCLDYVPE